MRVVAALAILCLLPMAQAIPGVTVPEGPVPTTLYLHTSGFVDAPMNLHAPPAWYNHSYSPGIAGHSGCVTDPTGQTFLTDQTRHTWYSYASPGAVAYDRDEFPAPHGHPQRGLTADVELAGDAMSLWITFRSNLAPETNNIDADPTPTVFPDVVVRGTVRQGDDISVGHEAFNTGPVVAQGETPATLLAGQRTQGGHVMYEDVDGQHLYTFRVDMPIQDPVIPAEESFNLRIDLFVDDPHCSGPDRTMPDLLHLYSDAAHRPRLEMDVTGAMRSDLFEPVFIQDDLVLFTTTASPWGNYDIVPQGGDLADVVDVRIDGPADPRLDMQHYDGYNCHCRTQPLEGTFVWKDISKATQGVYDVTITIPNSQGTAEVVYAFQFEVGNHAPKVCMGETPERFCVHDAKKGVVAPGLAQWSLTVALLGLVLLRRR